MQRQRALQAVREDASPLDAQGEHMLPHGHSGLSLEEAGEGHPNQPGDNAGMLFMVYHKLQWCISGTSDHLPGDPRKV